MLTLAIEKRDPKVSADAVRKTGKIPAVFYGRKAESTPISVAEVPFMKMWKQAGESSVVVLQDADGDHESLIHDVVKHPVSGKVIHADFYILEKGKKVKVKVPLTFVGVSDAVKSLGGILVKVLHEVEIEATPVNLPHDIEVDISSLTEIGSQIHASDIKLPNGVELIESGEEVIALVSAPKEEKEEEAAPIDLSAIEVEKKGKKEEEGGAPAEAPKE